MVTRESVEQQLKEIGFNYLAWGRTEVRELPHIILPDEEIYECVNGFYEAGFALLIATNFRVLLVDKKPLNYLTVEDLRFDMISEIDYSHRLLAAQISISTGTKNLRFHSFNKPRLRKLIGHVQHCMADTKKKQSEHEEDQKLHLEQINQQLQAYLLAQHQERQKLQQQLDAAKSSAEGKYIPVDSEPPRPSPELADFLYAQSLLAKHQDAFQKTASTEEPNGQTAVVAQAPPTAVDYPAASAATRMADLYAEGLQEVFGSQPQGQAAAQAVGAPQTVASSTAHHGHGLEINPLKVAYSKLPLAMRNRKFGRPSFHAHSNQDNVPVQPDATPVQY